MPTSRRNHVEVGIRQQILQGMVSEYECRDVAIKANYTWLQWLELDDYERAQEVARSRIALAIEAHTQEAYQRDAERKSRTRKN